MDRRFARIAARLMTEVRRHVPIAPPPPPEAERQSGIVALRRALQARRGGLRLRAVLRRGAAATALAVAATFVGAMLTGRGHFTSFRELLDHPLAHHQSVRAWGTRVINPSAENGGPEPPDGTQVRLGQLLDATASTGARLSFSGGTEVSLTQHTQIALKEAGAVQRLHLARGRLRAEVAPMGKDQRFLIETPDGEIEVHGTIFEVAVVAPQEGCSVVTQTRVTVSRGVVEVRAAGRDDHVRAGGHWPAECEPLGTPRAAATSVSAASPAVVEPSSSHPPPASPPPPTRRHPRQQAPHAIGGEPSELTTQNNLFARAMAAKDSGQMARAVEELERLIVRFPQGPLAEAAHVERIRIYQRVGNAAASRQHSREYLRHYPDGFARSEAHLILGRP